MKRNLNTAGARLVGLFAGLLALVGLSACAGDAGNTGSPTGTVTLAITDGPADELDALTVTIQSATLIGSAGHVDVPFPNGDPITLNVLDLDGINQVLTTASIPVDQYSKLRLSLGDASVTWPDGTVDPVTIVANGRVDLNFQGAVELVEGASLTIQLDFSAEHSLKLTATGNGKLILRPQIFVTAGMDATDPDNPPVDDLRGIVESVDPGARTFELRTLAGPRITVVVTDGTIIVSDGQETTFDAIQTGLRVHVEGSLQYDGSLIATIVHLAPERYAEFGVIANLDSIARTFDLLHIDRDPTPVHYTDDTPVLFRDHRLSVADLANGQVVRVGGQTDDMDVFQATVVRIRGDRFTGIVTSIAECASADTLAVKIAPHRLVSRLAHAGVILPDDTITVESRHPLPCPLLIHEGSLVRVWGRLAPDAAAPGGVTFLAARVEVLPGHAFVGDVTQIAPDTSDPTVGVFLMHIGPQDGLVSTALGILVEATIRVHVTSDTVFSNGLAFDSTLIGQRVGVLGRFIKTAGGIQYVAAYVKPAD